MMKANRAISVIFFVRGYFAKKIAYYVYIAAANENDILFTYERKVLLSFK